MEDLKLYMLLLGTKPKGRHTEQHDIFFCIGRTIKECLPDIFAFWPEANRKIHIDAWREVKHVDGHIVNIIPRNSTSTSSGTQLFFINLGGYKPNEFEEFHYKIIVAATDKDKAILKAKKQAFFLHTHSPHVDDKYGVDVDDLCQISDILPSSVKEKYAIGLVPGNADTEDEIHLGYLKVENL